MHDHRNASMSTQIPESSSKYHVVPDGKVTNMMQGREPDKSSTSDKRVFVWWVAGHLPLFVAIAAYPVYLLAVSGIQPSVALIGGLAVVLAMNLELILLMRGLKRGVVRRVVSRYGWETGVLGMVYLVMAFTLIITTQTVYGLAFRGSWARFSGQFVPGIETPSSSRWLFTGILALTTLTCIALVRRHQALRRLRTDHCINCGYPFDPDGELCSECGCARWHEG